MYWIEPRKCKSGTRYYVRGKINGQNVPCKRAGSSWQNAFEIKTKLNNEAIRGENGLVIRKDTALKTAADEYYETVVKSACVPSSWPVYQGNLKYSLDFFGPTRAVGTISTPDMIKFRTHLLKTHNTNGMLHIMRITKTLFNFCVESGYIIKSPGKHVTRGFKPKAVSHFLTDEEIRHIRANCRSEEFRDIINVCLLTGLREAEVSNLSSSWLIGDTMFAVGKGNKVRPVPIFSKVRPILQKYMAPGTSKLFPGWNVDRIKMYWHRLIQKSKKTKDLGRTRFHDLRHTFASNLLQDGVRIEDLQIILGHESIVTTQRYTHKRPSHLSLEIEKMRAGFLEDAVLKVV